MGREPLWPMSGSSYVLHPPVLGPQPGKTDLFSCLEGLTRAERSLDSTQEEHAPSCLLLRQGRLKLHRRAPVSSHLSSLN